MAEEKQPIAGELRERCLDFAKRMCFNAWPEITEARKKKLWSDAEWFLTDCLDAGATGWEDEVYACDWFHERFDEKYWPNTEKWNRRFDDGEQPRFLQQLNVVCRIAFDSIDGIPGGVWGFTIADFKRMHGGKLPDWLDDGEWMIKDDGKAVLAEAPDETMIPV